MQSKIFKNIIFVFIILLTSTYQNFAQQSDDTVIIYKNEPLRDIAKEYLHNPDYWKVILLYNNISSITELKEGTKLKIPTGLVSNTLEQISLAKNNIIDANKNGAKVLTPDLIEKAEYSFIKAMELKQKGDWKDALDSSKEAAKLAMESLRQAKLLRESSADAAISFTKGDVEKKKANEKLWSSANLYTKLYEADKARTMANSFAEITFIDMSRIRLNENSQALIQHSRIDLLKNKTDTKVKLIKGDAFAYLLKSPKKKFDIDIPGLDVKIKSKSFWIEKETSSTKIANFEGEIELKAKDVVVVVKENQGTIIPDGGVPSEPKELLMPPQLISPDSKAKLYKDKIDFNWKKVVDAKTYWLEIASDASFQKIIYSNKLIKNTSFSISELKPGIKFWHVATIDENDFPGSFSKYNYFMVINDVTAPFLFVASPKQFEVTKLSNIKVVGESEPELKLTINGKIVRSNKDGTFEQNIKLNNGINKIVISSEDPSGNKSEIIRTVFYEASKDVENIIENKNFIAEQNLFIVNNSHFQIRGRTRPLSSINFLYEGRESKAFADTNGFYTSTFLVSDNSENFTQIITTPAGYSLVSNFKIWFDENPPVIELINNIPRVTKSDSIKFIGSVLDGDSLFINSRAIKLLNGKFNETIEIIVGNNKFNLVATDIAGNSGRKTFLVVKDSEPPRLLDYKIKQVKSSDNEFSIIVNASDKSELKKTAIVTLVVDGIEKEIVLLLNNNSYSTKVYTNNKLQELVIKSILLEDYLGNKKIYNIN